MRIRKLATTPRTESATSGPGVCFVTSGLTNCKTNGSNIGHLDNRSKITEKKILGPKRKPENLHWQSREKTSYRPVS